MKVTIIPIVIGAFGTVTKRLLKRHFWDNICKRTTAHYCTQLNGFKYFYLTWTILFNINYLFADREVVTSIVM